MQVRLQEEYSIGPMYKTLKAFERQRRKMLCPEKQHQNRSQIKKFCLINKKVNGWKLDHMKLCTDE